MRIYHIGERVVQPQFGAGTIVRADQQHTVVDFDDHGLRTFSTPLVTLVRTAVARTAPKRRGGSDTRPMRSKRSRAESR
jgi:hypothetical protein